MTTIKRITNGWQVLRDGFRPVYAKPFATEAQAIAGRDQALRDHGWRD